jgi:hypothetical protein
MYFTAGVLESVIFEAPDLRREERAFHSELLELPRHLPVEALRGLRSPPAELLEEGQQRPLRALPLPFRVGDDVRSLAERLENIPDLVPLRDEPRAVQSVLPARALNPGEALLEALEIPRGVLRLGERAADRPGDVLRGDPRRFERLGAAPPCGAHIGYRFERALGPFELLGGRTVLPVEGTERLLERREVLLPVLDLPNLRFEPSVEIGFELELLELRELKTEIVFAAAMLFLLGDETGEPPRHVHEIRDRGHGSLEQLAVVAPCVEVRDVARRIEKLLLAVLAVELDEGARRLLR